MAVVAEIGEGTKKKGKGGVKEVRWAGHYSSAQRILLVGEGDFSFSLSLAISFGSASNIVATSLDSHDDLVKKYSKAQSNLNSLREMGATVLHGVDTKIMKFHKDLKMWKFNRIVFNFPHAGFKGKEDDPGVIEIDSKGGNYSLHHLCSLHRILVRGFFSNACDMLRPYGEVHISHKTAGPFKRWDLEELASMASLLLVECSDFRIGDYPGYNNKRGDAFFCDEPFPLGKCSTFKFRIGFKTRFSSVPSEVASLDLDNLENIRRQNCLPNVAQLGYSVEGRPQSHDVWCQDYARGTYGLYTNEALGRTLPDDVQHQIPGFKLLNAHQGFADVGRALQCFPSREYNLYMNEPPGRTVLHDVGYSEELREQDLFRKARLKRLLVRDVNGSGWIGFSKPEPESENQIETRTSTRTWRVLQIHRHIRPRPKNRTRNPNPK